MHDFRCSTRTLGGKHRFKASAKMIEANKREFLKIFKTYVIIMYRIKNTEEYGKVMPANAFHEL